MYVSTEMYFTLFVGNCQSSMGINKWGNNQAGLYNQMGRCTMMQMLNVSKCSSQESKPSVNCGAHFFKHIASMEVGFSLFSEYPTNLH